MSFSSEIKQELSKTPDGRKHCRLALLAALTDFCGNYSASGTPVLSWKAENTAVAETVQRLLLKLFGIKAEINQEKSSRNSDVFSIILPADEGSEAFKTLHAKTMDEEREEGTYLAAFARQECCVRTALRGAFLVSGTLSNPDRFYHFEISCRSDGQAEELKSLIASLGIKARSVKRKNSTVVYVKDSDSISDLLGYMGATKGMLEMENTRIIREMRGNINRQVNCETANINKTANAAARQISDILLIEEKIGLDSLPNGLDETARLRIKCPECTLQELGRMHDPPIGKSGVNHRLRHISAVAERIRRAEETKP